MRHDHSNFRVPVVREVQSELQGRAVGRGRCAALTRKNGEAQVLRRIDKYIPIKISIA